LLQSAAHALVDSSRLAQATAKVDLSVFLNMGVLLG
jgi:hypothetical protein